MLFRLSLVILVSILGNLAAACISAPFDIVGHNGLVIAQVQGQSILNGAEWEVYGTGATDDGYEVTRYRAASGNYTSSLWRYTSQTKQPGIIWAVWHNVGMFEGFGNIYKIQTNARSLGGGRTNLTRNSDGSYQVGCQ